MMTQTQTKTKKTGKTKKDRQRAVAQAETPKQSFISPEVIRTFHSNLEQKILEVLIKNQLRVLTLKEIKEADYGEYFPNLIESVWLDCLNKLIDKGKVVYVNNLKGYSVSQSEVEKPLEKQVNTTDDDDNAYTKLKVQSFLDEIEKEKPAKKFPAKLVEFFTTEHEDIFRWMPLSEIVVSPLDPQAKRRARFDKQKLSELADSIRQKGVIQPVVVRQTENSQFELVAGERRFLASQIAKKETIPAIIRQLTDEQVAEIQLLENLQREDLHPLDEADAYAYLKKILDCDLRELALRVGKSEKFVAQRLKLNDLIEEVKTDLAAGNLPLAHALEIAKFKPENQIMVFGEAFQSVWKQNKYQPLKNKPLPLSEFKEKIQDDIYLSLDNAVFELNDSTLRADGLTCPNCSENSKNASQLLFDDFKPKAKESFCLNATCFQAKNIRFVQIKREKMSAEARAHGFPEKFALPLLARTSNQETLARLGREIGGEVTNLWNSTIVRNQFSIETKPAELYAELLAENCAPALEVTDSGRFDEVIFIKTESEKQTAKNLTAEQLAKKQAEIEKREALDKAKRSQEIFDIKVGEEVRKKVLRLASEEFAEKIFFKTIAAVNSWFLLGLAKLYEKVPDSVCRTAEDVLEKPKYHLNNHGRDGDWAYWANEKLREIEIRQLYFLLITGHYGEMLYGNWTDQTAILEIAEKFEINYLKLDAAERLARSPKKYMVAAQSYFNAVERGEKDAIKLAAFYAPEALPRIAKELSKLK